MAVGFCLVILLFALFCSINAVESPDWYKNKNCQEKVKKVEKLLYRTENREDCLDKFNEKYESWLNNSLVWFKSI